MEQVAIQHYGMDAVFDSVAADEPAFAGSYLGPDGRMVLNVARGGVLRNVSHVIEGVAPLRRRSELGRPEFLMSSTDAPTVQTVDYTWKELIEAKDKVHELPNLEAVSMVDADERLNRVVVGVVAAPETTSVRAALRQAGVADGIAQLEVQPRAGQDQTLLDRVRPIRGGLEIRSGGRCSAALVAAWHGTPVLLTNSHCSSRWSQIDAGPAFQAWYEPFGHEIFDTQTYRCGWYNFWKGQRRYCRRADLAAYSLASVDVLSGELAHTRGTIHRLRERNWGRDMRVGDITIDPVNPTFVVWGTLARVHSGQVLERIGITSGWQSGPVTRTCVDWPNEHLTYMVCQTYADLFSRPGDSGGPVFLWTGENNVLLVGINWGSLHSGPPGSVFSDVTQMLQEMPGLVFTP